MKKFKIFCGVLLLALFSCFLIPASTLYADGEVATHISVSPGEDASTEAGFNWFSPKQTSLEITLKSDTEYASSQVIAAECAAPDFGNFPMQNFDNTLLRCTAEVDGLTPGGEYRYRIKASDTEYTADRFFDTAAGSGEWSFIAIADTQIYTSSWHTAYQNVTKNALDKAATLGVPEPKLMVGLGDMVENGYEGNHWDFLFDNEMLGQMQISYVVGNHEYVTLSPDHANWTSRYYDVMYNNPKNGPEHYQNSAYYFEYNDCLMVFWNSFNFAYFQEQADWLDNLLTEKKSKYVIFSSHYPCIGGSDSTRMVQYVTPILQKHGVDFALAGHNHAYAYYDNLINSQQTNDEARGFDHLLLANTARDEVAQGVYSIVHVTDAHIHIMNFNASDFMISDYYITPRRVNTDEISTDFDKQQFIDDIKIKSTARDSSIAEVSWDAANSWGNALTIDVTIGSTTDSISNYSTKVSTREYSGYTMGQEYDCKLVVTYNDGTKLERSLKFSPEEEYGELLNVTQTESKSQFIYKFDTSGLVKTKLNGLKVYANDILVQEVSLESSNVRISRSNLDETKPIVIQFRGVTKNNVEVVVYETTINPPTVDPTISLNKTTTTLQEKANETLTATLSDSTLKVVWSSSDASVATVDANGKVEALKAGTATITATIEGTTISSNCTVTVEAAPVVDPTIALNKTAVTLQEKANETLNATVSDATLKVVWSSSDASVATVDANGKVEAKKAGNATITATIEGTTISANCTVTVEAAPVVDPTISLNKTTVTLQEKANETLTATLSDSTLKVVWSSSDASVATVDANGKVEAKKAGNAVITATIEGTTISANCTVTVEAQDNCNSGTVIIFLSALGLVTFVLRRRRLF